jgi:hypothetical protein
VYAGGDYTAASGRKAQFLNDDRRLSVSITSAFQNKTYRRRTMSRSNGACREHSIVKSILTAGIFPDDTLTCQEPDTMQCGRDDILAWSSSIFAFLLI